MPLFPRSLENERKWRSDKEYLCDQDEHNSWGSASPWGMRARGYFTLYGEWLSQIGKLFHDDTVADFGGNDGTAANQFYMDHKIKPLVIDCDTGRLNYAKSSYGLPVLHSFVESIPDLKDKSIRWGFCSHTLEHMRDAQAGLREMARIIFGGCLFIIPLEPFRHAVGNPAHARCSTKISEWKALVKSGGWKIVKAEKKSRFELAIYAEPV